MAGNIIITGFMGTGKTTVGRYIAKELIREFRDTDLMITKKTGMSINAIFATQGEVWFRKIEFEALGELAQMNNIVIATGGGTLLEKTHRELMQNTGIIFNLKARPETIFKRLSSHDDRPLLKLNSRNEIMDLLESRETAYAQFGHQVDTSDKSVEVVAREIIDLWHSMGTDELD